MSDERITEAEIAELERFHSDGVVIEDGQRLYAAGSYCGDCRAYRPCPTATLLAERREREAKLARFERREMHVCGDPSAACDGDCAHEGWTAIELRKAEAKLARAQALGSSYLRTAGELCKGRSNQVDRHTAGVIGRFVGELREALADPPPAPRVNADPRRQLEHLSKLVERWVLNEISTEDYHAAVKEIFAKQQETS